MVHKPTSLLIVVLVVSALSVSRAGPPECAGLGAAGQELCIDIQETDRAGGPTGAGVQFRGAGPATITQTIGNYDVDITLDLVQAAAGLSLTVTGTFEKTGAGDTRIAMTAEGGMSGVPLPGIGSLRLVGFATGTAAIQLGAGAGFDDLGLGDPLYSPFPRICEATLFNADTFDCIEIDQPLREGSIAVTIILSVDINDMGTIVDLPAGVGIGDVPAGGVEEDCLGAPATVIPLCEPFEGVARSTTPVFFGGGFVPAQPLCFRVEQGGSVEFTLTPDGVSLFGAFFTPPPFLAPVEDACFGFVESILFPPGGDTVTLNLEPGTYYCVVHREGPGADVPFTFDSDHLGCDFITDCNENGLDDAVDLESGTSEDCNENGVPDECDIQPGNSDDEDGDGIPDECQPPCEDCEICDNGIDDDGNGLVDCGDIACDGFSDCTDEDCGNEVDDDGDGFADCLDTECVDDDLCTEPEDCTNGLDDDGDGVIDCGDPDCAVDAACGDEICDDGLDNDGDSFIDCVDEDCLLQDACSTEICDDGVDNDGDGNVDCDDLDCVGEVSCESEICDDSVDNDGDGLVDCEDSSCLQDSVCLGTPYIRCDPSGDGETNIADTIQIVEGIFLGNVVTTCFATFDCNRDKVADISDAVYSIKFAMGGGPPPPPPFGGCGPGDIDDDCDSFDGCSLGPEICGDGIDNNFDGLIDCEDPACGEEDPFCIEICDDQQDNNGNGLADCADPDCANRQDVDCPPEICDDGDDNDSDFLVDCEDPDCENGPSCSSEEICDSDGGSPDCADPDCARQPACLLPAGAKIVHDGRDETEGTGEVVIELADGTLQTVFLKNKNRYANPGGGISFEPEITVRSQLFPGTFVECEMPEIPSDRLPDALLQFIPFPMPADDAALREYRRRVDLQCQTNRKIVVTQEGTGNQAVTVIRVYDGLGNLLTMQPIRKDGEFKKAIYNESTGEKTVVVEKDGMIHWTVFDVLTGNVIVTSTFGLQTTIEIVDIELVGGNILILEKWRGGIEARVRIFPTGGTEPIATLFIPGEFVTAADNGSNTKAVVTEKDGTVMQDLVTLTTTPPSTKGLAQNGIGGTHQHLQHDASLGRDRFVEVVYNQGRDQTTVRILDGATGTIIVTHIFNGKYRHVRKVAGTDMVAPRKVFIIERQGETDAHVVDLNTGRKLPVKTLPGKFKRLSVRGGSVTLETRRPTRTTSFRAY